MKKNCLLLILSAILIMTTASAQYENGYSSYSSKDCEQCFLVKLENVGSYTKVTFKFAALNYSTIYIAPEGYILDKQTNTRYALREAQNISLEKHKKTSVDAGEILTYYLYYDQIPETATFLDIMETTSPGSFNYYNIMLNSSGIYGVYNFMDESNKFINQNASLISRNKTEREERRENNTALGVGLGVATVAAAAAITAGVMQSNAEAQYYRLQITNKHTDPRNIYIAGEFIGVVPARSTKTFKLERNKYGNIESVQASGYLFYPNRESDRITRKPGPDQLLIFTF